jgi:hypothetical protein
MARNRTSKKTPARHGASKKSVLARRVEAAMRLYGDSRADAEAFARIKILPPAVRPDRATRQAIRRAVRQVMREYYEKNAKSLERS